MQCYRFHGFRGGRLSHDKRQTNLKFISERVEPVGRGGFGGPVDVNWCLFWKLFLYSFVLIDFIVFIFLKISIGFLY